MASMPASGGSTPEASRMALALEDDTQVDMRVVADGLHVVLHNKKLETRSGVSTNSHEEFASAFTQRGADVAVRCCTRLRALPTMAS